LSSTTSSSENMLVKTVNLDNLLRLAGEVIIASSNLGLTHKHFQQLYDDNARIDQHSLDSIGDLATTTSSISSNLHKLVQTIRTVDLKDLGFRTRRVVRDISRKTGKRVQFKFEGEETTIDKTIVEKLYDPISHQLRNAIDHGIEDANVRAKLGKPEEGTITVKVYNTESQTFVEIEDDGAGVDMESLSAKAVSEGLLEAGEPITEEIALDVMCRAGVSTATAISEVSGRGVGMDVVRSHILGLGGSISFESQKGKGSTFTLKVPLVSAVNIVDALVVRSGKYLFGFPISNVVSTMAIPKEEIETTLKKGEMVKYLDTLIPLHSLNYILDKEKPEADGDVVSVLVIEHKGVEIALRVSEFLAPQKLVIIPFDGTLDVIGLAGSTVMGGRKLGFIIETNGLVSLATGRSTRQSTASLTQKTLDGKIADKGESVAEPSNGKSETSADANGIAKKSGAYIETDNAPSEDSLKEFLLEIENMLPQLSEALFALETDPTNSDHMNSAFRLFHTIKGNLIMIGYSKGGETVHSVESVLDFARAKKIDLTPETMDVLMDGVSYVEEAVRKSTSGSWKDEVSHDIIEASAKLLPKVKKEPKAIEDVNSADIRFSHEASYRANDYRKKEVPFYICYIEFNADKQPPFLIACLIYKRISELGDVLGTVPPLVDIENGIVDRKIKLLFASTIELEKLEKILISHLTGHYGAEVVKLSSFK